LLVVLGVAAGTGTIAPIFAVRAAHSSGVLQASWPVSAAPASAVHEAASTDTTAVRRLMIM
jgi:hypothetical protein